MALHIYFMLLNVHFSLQAFSAPDIQKTLNTSLEKLIHQPCFIQSIPEDAQRTLQNVTKLFVIPLDTLLALLSFTFNSVVLAAVLRTRSIQRPSLLLLCSLSMTDVIWAIFSLVDNTVAFTHESSCPGLRGFGVKFVVALCLFLVLGNLAIISCDRLLAVSKPWWYRNHVTRSLAIKQVSFVWALSVITCGIGAASLYFTKVKFIVRLLTVVWYSLCILAILSCYIGIFIANARHRKAMNQYGRHMRTALASEKKIANTACLILIVLCFTTLPSLIVPFVLHLMGFSIDDVSFFAQLICLFVTLNGLINPWLNYGRNEDVRSAVRNLIRQRWFSRGVGRSHTEETRHRQITLFPLKPSNKVTVVTQLDHATSVKSQNKALPDT
ncbi:adrenocorticotropic hormone receptor-like [Montipora capricornis]|uniref:adrenocorticotropic hormone receptor-like n=1 Tax=Montipora capricornis TaxID=246305 RepID=UPI0035F129B3